jgi:hypothetical protein
MDTCATALNPRVSCFLAAVKSASDRNNPTARLRALRLRYEGTAVIARK